MDDAFEGILRVLWSGFPRTRAEVTSVDAGSTVITDGTTYEPVMPFSKVAEGVKAARVAHVRPRLDERLAALVGPPATPIDTSAPPPSDDPTEDEPVA